MKMLFKRCWCHAYVCHSPPSSGSQGQSQGLCWQVRGCVCQSIVQWLCRVRPLHLLQWVSITIDDRTKFDKIDVLRYC